MSPANVQPGQKLFVEAVFDSGSDTPIDAISLVLSGSERCATQLRQVLTLKAKFEATRFARGVHKLRAEFPLPASALPSHRGPLFVVEYDLRLHVEIPWWPDVDKSFALHIAQPPVRPMPNEVVFSSRSGEAVGADLYAEATLGSSVVAPNRALLGAVSFGNTQTLGRTKACQIELAFVGIEQGGGVTQEAHRFTAKLARETLKEGEAIPFRVMLPPSAPPTLKGHLGRIDWFFLVSIQNGWKKHPLLRIPIEVRPIEGGVERARVNAIGKERRSLLWSAAAAELGFTYDSDADVVAKRVGDVSVEVTALHRASAGPHVVASFAYGALGIDLDVKPKRWLLKIVGDGFEMGHPAFDRALCVDAREAHQARALLGEALVEALVLADEVRMDDTRATLAWASAGIDPAALRKSLSVVDSVAKALAHRIPQIPFPARLASSHAAWKALAESLGGRLRPGRPEVVGGETLGRSLSVRAGWGDAAEPPGVDIEVHRSADAAGDRALPKRAESARDALSKSGNVMIDTERVVLSIPDGADRPEALGALIEAVAELAALLDGRGAAGPYR